MNPPDTQAPEDRKPPEAQPADGTERTPQADTARGGAKDSGRGTAASSVMKQEQKTPFETGSRR